MFDAVAFAGGGNRCYWQGGFWEATAERLKIRPKRVVGLSAGAWAASYSLLGRGREISEMVADGCRNGIPNLEWRRGRPCFPVADLYRALLTDVLDPATFEKLRSGPELLIAISRAPLRLPLALAIALGIATYQIEKKLLSPVHPRGGRRLGFSREFVSVKDLDDPALLVATLMASASVPPFMPVGQVNGAAALDGGMVDNVPVEPLEPFERKGGRTLVLLSRRYRRLPEHPRRIYVQPSQKVPIGQFDITRPDGILAAFDLGLRDGEAFAAEMETVSIPNRAAI